MRKTILSLLTLTVALPVLAVGNQASITSTPSPAVSNKPLEIKISTSDLGTEVYCYTWCEKVGSGMKSPFGWNDVETEEFRMSGSGGTYTFTISHIAQFYGLSEAELAGLTQLGFIAKTKNGSQTIDLTLEVVQGRRDAYSGGEGTEALPFIIKTPADLSALAATPSDWSATTFFRMEADIDASSVTVSPIGSQSAPFKGRFDGMGHVVTGLRLASSDFGRATGLFGVVDGAEIRDLGIVDARVRGTAFTGILAGMVESGEIDRCFTTGSVTATSICAGGLVGENIAGNITDCYSGATVSNPDDYATGGLVGKNRGTVKNTYSAGAVEGLDYTGGLVGANYGTVKNSVALNESVTSSYDFSARFGGNNNARNLADAVYSWREMTSGTDAWGMHGHHASDLEAKQLTDEATFRSLLGWDFDRVWKWTAEAHKEYPQLRGFDNQECVLPDHYFDVASGIDETGIARITFEAAPNPVTTFLYLSSEAGIEGYALYALDGHLVLAGHAGGAVEATVDMGACPPGVYLLRAVTSDSRAAALKVVKK